MIGILIYHLRLSLDKQGTFSFLQLNKEKIVVITLNTSKYNNLSVIFYMPCFYYVNTSL